MELGDPGIFSVLGFGLVIIIGGLVMAAVSFFSMKETSYEDVVAAQKRKKEEEDKERSRLNKQKREHFKKKFEQKKKKDSKPGPVNGKLSGDGVSPVHEVQIKPIQAVPTEDQKKKKIKPKSAAVAEVPAKKKEAPAPPKVEVVKPMVVTPAPIIAHQAPVQAAKPAVQVVKPTKQAVPPRQPKVSFSEDVQEMDTKVQVEQKQKKKKGKKTEESPIIILIQSSDVDETVAKHSIEILKKKLGSGDWLTGHPEFADLRKAIRSREVEVTRCLKESATFKSKIQELTLKVEQQKSQGQAATAKLTTELEESQTMCESLKQQIQTLVKEKSKEATQAKVAAPSNDNLKKIKEENEILKMTIQANASEVKEKQRLAVELKRVTEELKQSESSRCELEKKMQEYNGSIQQKQAQLETSHSKRIEEITKELRDAHEHYGSLESDFQKAQSDLHLTQTESAKLLDQVVMLTEANEQKSSQEGDYRSLLETKDALEKRLDEMDARDNEKADELAKLTTRNKDLKKETEKLSAKLKTVTDELANFKKDASSSQQQVVQQNTLLRDRDTKISKLESEMNANKNLVVKYQEEVEKMRKKNNELRERNWKAMDAVSAAEKMAKERVASAKEESSVDISNLESKVKASLTASFPDVTCDSTNFDEWIDHFVKSVSKTVIVTNNEVDDATKEKLANLEKANRDLESNCSKLKSDASALQRSLDGALKRSKDADQSSDSLKDEVAKKEAELEKFKLAIASTEQLLSDLQTAAEKQEREREELKNKSDEERKKAVEQERKEKCDMEQKLLEKTKLFDEISKERNSLQEKLCKIETELEESKQNLSKLKEAAAEELRDAATGSFPSRDQASSSLSLCGVEISEDAEHGFLIVDQQPIGESRDAVAVENGNSEDEIEKLKERLDKEKQLTKDLGAAAGKLQTVLKQTQEQLNKERQKNKALSEKRSKKDSSSSSSSSSSSDLD